MNLIEEIGGELCKILLPIQEEIFFGDSKSNIAVCTLSSINLLRVIVKSSLINEVVIAGRLLSENKGIDSLIKSVVSNNKIDTIILCGIDAIGHKAGHSLLCLYKNGIDENCKIIGAQSPHPILTVTKKEVEKFQKQVKVIDIMGEDNLSTLKSIIESHKHTQ